MSLSDKMKNAGATPAPKTAPSAPAVTAKKGTNPKTEAFQSQGAAIRAQMSDDEKALEGSKSATVEFIACLGNPAKKQSRKSQGEYKDSQQVIGYIVKPLEDMEVPVAPLKEDCKTIFDVQAPSTRAVKAGEEVYLNIMETAMMISKPEFGGEFKGNGKNVFLSVVFSKTKEKPTPCLKRPTAEGSIKTNMVMVAEKVGAGADGQGGSYQTIDGCEQFAVLFKKRNMTRRGSGAGKQAAETTKNTAAAFRAMFGM